MYMFSIIALFFLRQPEHIIDECTPVRGYSSGTPVSFPQSRRIPLNCTRAMTYGISRLRQLFFIINNLQC
jgi:hypothetical protein